MMTFGSLFTGVRGMDMGAEVAGMKCRWMCEWDRAADGVNAFHCPKVPQYADVTKFYPNPKEHAVDAIFGGSPCQDLSVAGLRAGLDGERSGLFRQMVRVCKRLRPRFIVWENVPGALSSNEGRDFAAVLRAWTGLQVEVPKEGWGNAGFLRTPFPSLRWNVAWRVFDSQYFGVPQRRRRIFLVGSLRDASCVEILFEPESVCGNPPPSREAGQGTTGTLSARTQGGGGLGTDFECQGGLQPCCMSTGQAGAEIGIGIGTTLNCDHEAPIVTHSLRAEGFDASEDGTGRRTPLVPVAFNHLMGSKAGGIAYAEDQAPTLGTRLGGGAIAYRTTGNDGCYETGDKVGCLNTATDPSQNIVAIPILEAGARTGVSTDDPRAGMGVGENGDPMFTLQSTKQHAVAFDLRGREGGSQFEGPHDTANIRSASGVSSRSYAATQYGVRRLTPRECERLQGWPDDHTLWKQVVDRVGNRWVIRPGAPLPQADGPRYKQCGNGVTKWPAHWIAKQILKYSK